MNIAPMAMIIDIDTHQFIDNFPYEESRSVKINDMISSNKVKTKYGLNCKDYLVKHIYSPPFSSDITIYVKQQNHKHLLKDQSYN